MMSVQTLQYTSQILSTHITETWLGAKHLKSSYQLSGYNSYTSCRKSIAGGGTTLPVDCQMSSIQLTPDVTNNDAYNLCAAAIGNRRNTALIFNAFRAPWATCEDTLQMCEQIDTIAKGFERIIVSSDFNLPKMQWTATKIVHENQIEEAFRQSLTQHSLYKQRSSLPDSLPSLLYL